MKKRGKDGANTQTGLRFESKVDFLTFIKNQEKYSVKGAVIFYDGKKVGLTFKKQGFYKYLGGKELITKK